MDGVRLPQMPLYLTGDADKTSYSSALIPDTEEFESIVSVAERLTEQVTFSMEVESQDNQAEDLNSSGQRESSVTNQNGTALPEAEATTTSPTAGAETFSSLLPKALSAVVQARLPPGPASEAKPCRKHGGQTSPRLEQLQTELHELRGQFEQMKTQHNKEIKLLMNELDEEKRIRLTLQMEIQRMKKHLSK